MKNNISDDHIRFDVFDTKLKIGIARATKLFFRVKQMAKLFFYRFTEIIIRALSPATSLDLNSVSE